MSSSPCHVEHHVRDDVVHAVEGLLVSLPGGSSFAGCQGALRLDPIVAPRPRRICDEGATVRLLAQLSRRQRGVYLVGDVN